MYSKVYTVYVQDCNHCIGKNSTRSVWGGDHSGVACQRPLQTFQLIPIRDTLYSFPLFSELSLSQSLNPYIASDQALFPLLLPTQVPISSNIQSNMASLTSPALSTVMQTLSLATHSPSHQRSYCLFPTARLLSRSSTLYPILWHILKGPEN